MDKSHILDEIRRTAKENGGQALGVARFFNETGIRESDWRGKLWARWGDAVREAGLEPNVRQGAYDETWLIEHLVGLIRRLGKFPTVAEINMEARRIPDLPAYKTFGKRFGRKDQIAARIVAYCREQDGLGDVIELCEPIMDATTDEEPSGDTSEETGFVYLMKSGRYFKIGRTNALDRRQYEIGIQLPEGVKPIHSIRTDDPSGIEAYWHHRFKDKRMQGEWFKLTAKDVAIFKKRKFM